MDTLTADPLLAALRDGGQCSADQLVAMEQAFARVGSEPAALADALNQLGVLTRYQFRKVQLGRVPELLFGQYLILEKIGEGGMGKVYRALDTRMSRMVALKVVRPQLMSNKTVLRRYEREAEAAGKLDHTNIVKLFDAGEASGRFYLAMEYVDGSDLSRLVKDNGALSTAEACEYMRLTALGLQHAHENGFVHRDIKPSNLLVYGERAIPGTGGRAQLKILDMGLIRSMADDDSPDHTELTRDGTVVGTPDYMSPEQAKNSSSVDPRADLYSLGCTLYYLLRGQVPFPEGTPIDKLIRHQLDPVPDVRQGRSDIPYMVGTIVTRLLSKKPDERYQTAAEVAALLGNFTPDAAVMDLSPPSTGSSPAPAIYDAVDLSPPPALESLVSPVVPPRRSNRPVVERTPKPGLPVVVTVVRPTILKAKPIPRPNVEPFSKENLSHRPEPKKVARPPLASPPSTRFRKPKARKKTKPSPILVLAGIGLFAALLLGVGIFFLVRLGNAPTVVTTPTVESKKMPLPVESPPAAFLEIETLLPDGTEAVLIYHAKPFWDKIASEWKVGSRLAKVVDFLNGRFHFDLRKFERGTVAFQADPTRVVASGEGGWLTPAWIATLEKAKRTKVEPPDDHGTQTVRFLEQGTPIRDLLATRGAILKGPAYLLSDDRGAFDSLLRRVKSQIELSKIDAVLLPPLRDAAKGPPTLFFAAAAGFQLPMTKAVVPVETLGTYGVDLLTVTGQLDRDFTLELVLTGRDDKRLKEFLGLALPKLFDARSDKLQPLADAIRSASDGAMSKFDSQRECYRVKVTVVWKWADVVAGLEAALPSVPKFDHKE